MVHGKERQGYFDFFCDSNKRPKKYVKPSEEGEEKDEYKGLAPSWSNGERSYEGGIAGTPFYDALAMEETRRALFAGRAVDYYRHLVRHGFAPVGRDYDLLYQAGAVDSLWYGERKRLAAVAKLIFPEESGEEKREGYFQSTYGNRQGELGHFFERVMSDPPDRRYR